MPKDNKLTVEKADADFKLAYRAKIKLIERERHDFQFALGNQWSQEDIDKLKIVGVTPFTDNRIQPNLFLLTGLERQNRTDFKAFPEGEEDGLKAEIASALFKDAIKKSGFAYKSSEQFKDGITCGESHLELYLDYTDSLLNGKPTWYKCDGDSVFPDPTSREYDFSDARYVYKIKTDISQDDLVNLYPEKQKLIESTQGGKLNFNESDSVHRQYKDYPKKNINDYGENEPGLYDLVERYYKKSVKKFFVGDKQTGEIKEAESRDKAEAFVNEYKQQIVQNETDYALALQQHIAKQTVAPAEVQNVEQPLPPAPPEQNPDRFIVIKRMVQEIWCYAYAPGMEEPLADDKAWFYPKWKTYPFVPYFARFSTAPLTGEDRHLLIQGVVHGVKGAQEKHNKAEMLMIRHLNTSTNSGWLSEENSWVDPKAVKDFGTSAGVNLEYKTGKQKPERITPAPLSQAHAVISAESAEAIKAQLGINADLLATQQGGADCGRAIALRQKQGLLMVQELFDNLTRSRQIAGRFLLSQLGEIYDTDTAGRVLGEAFLQKNFPPPMLMNEQTLQQEPMRDQYGQPMRYDKEMAELMITEVLSGVLELYDVSVGEAVASESQRMANSAEIAEFSKLLPGLIPPDILIRHSQLPESAKNEILSAIKQAQIQAAAMAGPGIAQGA